MKRYVTAMHQKSVKVTSVLLYSVKGFYLISEIHVHVLITLALLRAPKITPESDSRFYGQKLKSSWKNVC